MQNISYPAAPHVRRLLALDAGIEKKPPAQNGLVLSRSSLSPMPAWSVPQSTVTFSAAGW